MKLRCATKKNKGYKFILDPQPQIRRPRIALRLEGIRCRACGYDLSGNYLGDRCPECGDDVAESLSDRPELIRETAQQTIALSVLALVIPFPGLGVWLCYRAVLSNNLVYALYEYDATPVNHRWASRSRLSLVAACFGAVLNTLFTAWFLIWVVRVLIV